MPAHTVAMSHPYTTSPSDIFAPFHLKCAIWLATSLIARGYSFIETNLGKHNLAKLTNKQVTQNLQRHQCGPIIQDGISLIIISSHGPSLALAALL